jgi:hypothetical protein
MPRFMQNINLAVEANKTLAKEQVLKDASIRQRRQQ